MKRKRTSVVVQKRARLLPAEWGRGAVPPHGYQQLVTLGDDGNPDRLIGYVVPSLTAACNAWGPRGWDRVSNRRIVDALKMMLKPIAADFLNVVDIDVNLAEADFVNAARQAIRHTIEATNHA